MPSLRALHHPNYPVQISCNCRVKGSEVGKAENSLKRAYVKQLHIKFNESVDNFFTKHDELVVALAKELVKKKEIAGAISKRMLLNLYEQMGIRGIAIFSHVCTNNLGIPHTVDSDNTMEFMQQELDISSLNFLCKFNHWCARQDKDEPDVRHTTSVYSWKTHGYAYPRIRVLVPTGTHKYSQVYESLSELPTGTLVVNYNVTICKDRGVELAGVPSTGNIETAQCFCDGLCEGSINWVEMMKTQHKELKAEHNACHEEMGVGSLVKNAEGSDKGKSRSKKTNGRPHAHWVVQALWVQQ
ncbi:hypothetical protein K438DRAFT_1749021 [Mycena galopus ATCC 62051]|nr:hypothetical protein K438DRAFT_1749021 [Mycena galopus ATCC 62051]